MSQLPLGTVTFLMTDIEASSTLWERHPQTMPQAVARHHDIIRLAIEKHGGVRPADQGEGDSILGAFSRATDAVACALAIQLNLMSETWPDGLSLNVRMAIHTGEAELRDEDNYATPALNRCARIRGIAHGGQVLLSQSTWDLVRERPPSDVSFQDLGEHRLKDLASPEHVYQLMHPQLPDDFPPLRSLEQLPTNLPLQLTRFIGREQDIAEVKKILQSSRLVTLTGAAGCGKTRLVIQLAADLLEDYRDGVWFIDLSPLAEAEAVTATVASVLGIKERPGRALLDSIQEHLRGKETLLVLDNCEHVLAECAALALSLLSFSPFLRILGTSREALGVPGEAPWRVPSLAVPDPDSPPPSSSLGEYAAAQLFLDRAWAISPGLVLTEQDSDAITQICHRLDGIPLAIELAAARSQVLTFTQIASKLDDQFRLLTGGSRTALERQQTMRAAVEWSYKLLTEDERTLLKRLSVFSGGFGLESAEDICGAPPLEARGVLDLLSALVQKSLVSASRKGPAARYRLLETIRQFAREKLAEGEEGVALRTRHRDWFRDLAEEAESALLGPDQAQWGERLEEELDNIRAAIEWSNGLDEFEDVLRIGSALWRLWMLRHPSEGISVLETGLAGKGGGISDEVRSRALGSASFLHSTFGSQAKALELAEESVRLVRSSRSLNLLGNVLSGQGDYKGARAHYEEALEISRQQGDTRGAGALTANLARLAAWDGLTAEAQSRFEEALRMTKEAGDTFNVGMTLLGLGNVLAVRCDFDRARSCFEECLATWRSLETPGAFVPSAALAQLEIDLGDYDRARSWCEQGIEILREQKDALAVCLLGQGRGLLAYLNQDYGLARASFEEASKVATVMGQADQASESLLGAAFSSEGQGDQSSARRFYEEALKIGQRWRRPIERIPILVGLGRTAGAAGDLDAATRSLDDALATCLKCGDMVGCAAALEGLAGVAARRRDPRRAAELFGMAESVRESVRSKPWPHLQSRIKEEIAIARSALGKDAFEKAWAHGHSMEPKEAARKATDMREDE